MKSEFCIVFVTVPNQAMAQTIAIALLEAKLAACINFFPVQSIYTWQGEIQTDTELQLVVKTQTRLFPELQTLVQQHHTYEIPEILVLPIEAGFPPYLNWIKDSTTRSF